VRSPNMQKRKFPLGGREVEGVELSFEPLRETWNQYELSDGGRLRVRVTVQRIYQLLNDDGTHMKGENGERVMVVESSNQVVVEE